MVRIGLHLLGKKGFECLMAVHSHCLQNTERSCILFVEIAQDKNVQNDYYEDILAYCQKHAINHYKKGAIEATVKPDIHFAIGWRWLIHQDLDRLVILHDSLLPKYRGFNPLVTALIEGDKEVGVTALKADAQFDRGHILSAKKMKISYPIKIETAIQQMSQLYKELIVEVIEKKINNNLSEIPQDESLATYSLWRDDEDYFIDWNQDAERIQRSIDAMGSPYKGAAIVYDQQTIRIKESICLPDVPIVNRTPGKILLFEDKCPVVVCKSGLLKITHAITEDGQLFQFTKLRVRL